MAILKFKANDNDWRSIGLDGIGTHEMYGAIGDGKNDDTNAVKTAIANHKYVIATQDYLVTETIELHAATYTNDRRIFELRGSLILGNDESIVHVHGENVTLCGGGVIRKGAGEAYYVNSDNYNNSDFEGDIVVVGALKYTGTNITPDSASEGQKVSAIRCTIKDLTIINDNPEYKALSGITLRNYFLSNYGCYCNTIDNIYCIGTITGIDMAGDVNANNISNIIMRSLPLDKGANDITIKNIGV